MGSEPRALPGARSRPEAVAITRKREEVAKGRLLSLLVPSSRLGMAAGLATPAVSLGAIDFGLRAIQVPGGGGRSGLVGPGGGSLIASCGDVQADVVQL